MNDDAKAGTSANGEVGVGDLAKRLTSEEALGLARLNGRVGIPKGVYRFNSDEEADAWEAKMLTFNKKESDRS